MWMLAVGALSLLALLVVVFHRTKNPPKKAAAKGARKMGKLEMAKLKGS